MVSHPVTAFEGIDHIDCVSHDLETARQRFEELGFNVIGPIAGGDEPETATCWIVAAEVYLSCSGFRHFDRLHPIMQQYMKTEGVGAALWRMNDPELADRELRAAGFETYPAAEGRRIVSVRGEGREFRFLVLPFVPPTGVSTGDFLNLGMKHFTRHITTDAAHLRHPNGLVKFQRLTSIFPDLDAVRAGLTRLLGVNALVSSDEQLDVTTATLDRRFVSADRYSAMYGDAAGVARPKVVTLAVSDLNVVRERCSSRSIRFVERKDRSVLVSGHVPGIAFEFVS